MAFPFRLGNPPWESRVSVLWGVSLELHRIRTRAVGRVYDLDRLFETLAMVRRKLRNDIDWLSRTDSASADLDVDARIHWKFSAECAPTTNRPAILLNAGGVP